MVGSGPAINCDRDGDNQHSDDGIKFRVPTLRSVFAGYLGLCNFRFCPLGPRLFLWMALSFGAMQEILAELAGWLVEAVSAE